jgi:hypothetical protein
LVLPGLDDYLTPSPPTDGTDFAPDSLSSTPTYSETAVPTLKNSGASVGPTNDLHGVGRRHYFWLAIALGAFALFVRVGRRSAKDEET